VFGPTESCRRPAHERGRDPSVMVGLIIPQARLTAKGTTFIHEGGIDCEAG